MRLFRHFDETPEAMRGSVVALGNFDGMHLGHRAVIEAARDSGSPWGVLTFEPHPRSVLRPGQAPFRLTPMRVKARLIEEMGADFMLMQHFDLDFAARPAEQFVTEVLDRGLGARHVVVGYDFVFGRGRGGNAALLERMSAAHGFSVTSVAPVSGADGQPYSATRIREALQAARPAEAARLLGRAWEIEGRVAHGDGRGRGLGMATANIGLGESLVPAAGIYAVRVCVEEPGSPSSAETMPGVAYCGPRPTFCGTEVGLEVHLFDFAGDLYGKHLRVALIDYLRPDRRFDDPAALAAQMAEDGRAARRILGVPIGAEAGP